MSAPRIVSFESAGVGDRYRDKAMRIAVLVPYGGKFHVGVRRDDRDEVERRCFSLLAVWRARVRELAECDYDWPGCSRWPSTLGDDNAVYLANCRPAFIVPKPDGIRSCNRLSICPFCWCGGRVTSTTGWSTCCSTRRTCPARPARRPAAWSRSARFT